MRRPSLSNLQTFNQQELPDHVTYTEEQAAQLRHDLHRVSDDLLNLNFKGMAESEGINEGKAREYLTHGVGRRLSVLKMSTEAIFRIFPPERDRVLSHDEVTEVQIYLHAFVMNLFGVFDNWAWAFLHRHGLVRDIGNPSNVGLFKPRTQRLLPTALREYLTSDDISRWNRDYLKGYRDALAHRIPLYVPPGSWTAEDRAEYERLEREKARLAAAGEWRRLHEVWDEQDIIGRPCPLFMHETAAEDAATPVYLHPQVLSDGATVVDFGFQFYKHWQHRAE